LRILAKQSPTSQSVAKSDSKSQDKPDVVDQAPPAAISKEQIPKGSRVYIAPINGYETYIVAGIMKKEVPVVDVNSREKADYEISGVSESHQAGWQRCSLWALRRAPNKQVL